MDLETLKPNSKKYKMDQEEKKPLEKVVSSPVKVKKKSSAKKFLDLFINEDVGSVKEYVIFDVIIPAIKDTLVDLVNRSTEMLFYGRVKGGSTRKAGQTYVSYSSYSRPSDRPTGVRARSVYSFDDIVVESRGEAERVLDILNDMIDQYGEATVADFYELVGVSGNGYTDRSYGWKDLKNAYISRVREGYLFNLPRCIELD